MSKKGLGRGLDSLFSNYIQDEDFAEIPKNKSKNMQKSSDFDEIHKINIELVDRNPKQPRKKFDEKSLSELAQSIKSHGVIQPIVVTKRGSRYIIVAGERRWRASKQLGLKTIPAVIRDYSDKDVAEISIIENLQREDLNPIESARAIKELIEKFDMTQENVADKIGKSRPAVANTLRLLTLSSDVIALVEEGRLSAGHARTLVPIENKSIQLELANIACDNKITVRELERYIKNYQNPKQHTGNNNSQSLEIRDFTRQLQDAFATKVSIQGNEAKGKICINYYSKDDLERIYTILNSLNRK